AVGGSGVISEDIFDELPDSERLAGKDRYGTSAAVAEHFDWSPSIIHLAKGSGYADALTGSLRAAYLQAPLLLTPETNLSPATVKFLDE
ncbi:cell wall-binding repeat-containing protein, partial [Micrococcus sp. SIMBA_131]